MKIKPEFKVEGKKLVVDFKEALKARSTYTLNFGNAIEDYTEGNPLVNYEYVFSTGDHIDSLSIPGKVLNAFNHKPEEGIIAMVYQDDNDTVPLDSLPLRVPPKSASKTTKDGTFRINNLAAGTYKLFALEDLNNNFIYDLPTERIAFLDSMITLKPPEPVIIPVDSTDTTETETPALPLALENNFTLYLFEQIDSTQKLLSKKLVNPVLIQYIFRMPVNSFKVFPFDFQPGVANWHITEFNKTKDTVNLWLKPVMPDAFKLRVTEGNNLADTAKFFTLRSVLEKAGRRRDASAKKLNVTSSVYAGALDLNKNFTLFFAVPIEYFDPARLILDTPNDTIVPVFSLSDTLLRQGEIKYKWRPSESYQLVIIDSAFCDLSGSYNDSISIKFRVRAQEDYGTLLLNIILPELQGQFIVQLMTEKEIVVQQKIISSPELIRFDYLMPANYMLKIIFDSNSNGIWDPGNYGKKSLPERVEYYPTALSIRANWDMQEEWQPVK
jgi:uncharacterized protein (DUF2141 family)